VSPPVMKYHLKNHILSVRCVIFHATLAFLATSFPDRSALLYDISTLPTLYLTSLTLGIPSLPLTVKYRLKHHTEHICSIVFHDTLQLLATGSHDSTIILYDLTTKPPSIKYHLKNHKGSITSIAFHPRLPLLSSGSNNSHIMLYNLDHYFFSRQDSN
tara:strand:+ start:751 stop:1224 length:474 start_codon:yes stop_codon:yes gene_type:complete